ncbi:MAG TPA: ribose ABC transporter permease [Chthoniobacterales bacterium]|jgi:ribose transport system permease protein|nr:ribose ABC transporter permease [Chthoniobacterales bacterium]
MVTEATTQTAAVAADKRKEFTRSIIQLAGMVPVLVVICILFALLTPNFLTQNNMVNVVRQASINIVLAAGMTFVILTGGIDLAVGSVLGFTAVIAVVVSLIPGLDWAAVPAALLAGALVGVLTGMTVAYIGLPPFIVTLGTYTAIRGAAYLAAGGTTVINSKIGFAWIGNGYVGPVPWLVIIALLTVAISAFILHSTVLGVHVYAVGGNPQAARLTGIPVPFVLIFVYGVSGLLSGLGGVMSASRLYSAQGQLGIGYELDAIAAVILGGTSFSGGIGTVFGTLIGALIIAVLNNGLTLMNVSFYWQLVIKGAVIVLAVMLDKLRTRGQAV